MSSGLKKVLSSHKFIQKLWTLHLKITNEIEKHHLEDSSLNLVKFTNQFIKKMTNGLMNFSYNIIIANLHEMCSYLNKEIEKKYKRETILENYKKILISMMPIIPHFSNECLNLININKDFNWPDYDESLLVEDFVNIVVQINGKKRGLINVKKNILEDEVLEIINKDINMEKYLKNNVIKKKIFIPNKLINIII